MDVRTLGAPWGGRAARARGRGLTAIHARAVVLPESSTGARHDIGLARITGSARARSWWWTPSPGGGDGAGDPAWGVTSWWWAAEGPGPAPGLALYVGPRPGTASRGGAAVLLTRAASARPRRRRSPHPAIRWWSAARGPAVEGWAGVTRS
jgi:hypothetical protein